MATNFALGKKDYKDDVRTLSLANYINPDIQVPVSYDFDRYRAKFPYHLYHNDEYGDCVLAARANHLLRLERAETKRTVKVSDDDVLKRYKELTGCQFAGDQFDSGLVMLDLMNDWRSGWKLAATPKRNYNIQAFGKVNIDPHLLRSCIYLFNGIELGIALPRTAQDQTSHGYWDIVHNAGQDSAPGSWGGHAVYAKRYDAKNIYVITWGQEIRVSNEFIAAYADEAWTCVDSLDAWRNAPTAFNVEAMEQKMQEMGIQVVK